MGNTFRVSVKPELLSFAIKRSGYSIEGLVKRINERFRVKYFDTNYLKEVLEGKISPQYSDLIVFPKVQYNLLVFRGIN